MMELWDAYYADSTLAGVDLVRGESIEDGLYQVVSDIFVMHKDGSILLMQRDYSKTFPGQYEASAGGSILKGETPYQGAIRELKEETGILTDNLDLIAITVDESRHTIYYNYKTVTDVEKSDIVLQKGETIGYKWLNRDEFMEFIKTDKFIATDRSREFLNKPNEW